MFFNFKFSNIFLYKNFHHTLVFSMTKSVSGTLPVRLFNYLPNLLSSE